ncbi:MAG: hypothetical protein KAS46_07115 [Candidatus Aureabacteria bacterium]|nr:hypothetical protein [Candidatus Auribacterota bacterium]
MKGERVRQFFNSETKALLALYKNIETLIPSSKKAGAAHVAEEGRYIESIIRHFLNKHLPNDLKAFSGFILRPATKTGNHDRTRRRGETDKHSKQLDIIVYDHKNYPVFESFEEFAIVPPEGVVGIVSVKKNLYEAQIKNELISLSEAAELCHVKCHNGQFMRGPSTCLVAFSNKVKINSSFKKRVGWIFEKIKSSHNEKYFDQYVGQIIALNAFTVFKKRPNSEENFNKKVEYIAFNHSMEEEYHFGLQFLLSGILAAYYHESRKPELRPGFTSFKKGRGHDIVLGHITTKKLR